MPVIENRWSRKIFRKFNPPHDAMGCCASLPSADDFFATAPPPSIAGERPRLIDGLPNTVTVNPSPVVMSSIGSTDNSDGGVGPPFTADICDVGGTQVLARLQLPPHRSFGIGATLFDSAGAPVASLRSAHSTRQHGSSSSSYHVLAKAPLFAGQAPTASGEYLWATVTRAPFSLGTTITQPSGEQILRGQLFDGPGASPPGYTLRAVPNMEGVMLAGRTPAKKHLVQVADGADPAFAICLMYCYYLASDELYVSRD